ncbi:MAG: DUF58 domain-containing protein [Planctomycetes bacterium]|nr:DUF58 domain-containing protein [Planctomycetota bacterium]
MPKYKYLPPKSVKKLGNIELVAKQIVEGFLAGLHRSPFHGFSVEFAEYREYTPGDDLKHLDWQQYAKSDRYYIKQYHEETNLRSWIVLDTSASMGFAGAEASDGLTKFEYGAYLAASLMYLLQKQGDNIGLVTFSDEINKVLPTKGGQYHLQECLRTIEKTKPEGESSIAQIIHKVAEMSTRRSLIIVISDLYDDPNKLVKAFQHLRHNRQEVLLFQILDNAELNLPYAGMIEFRDLETRRKLLINPNLLRDDYKKQLDETINTFVKSCSDSNIDYRLLDTSVPFELALGEYLNKRARLS